MACVPICSALPTALAAAMQPCCKQAILGADVLANTVVGRRWWQYHEAHSCLQNCCKLVYVGLAQLQQLACGATLLAEPLRGAVIRALEMERKCCKWCAGTLAASLPPLLLPVC